MRAVNAAQPWSWLVGDARLPGQAVVVLPSELEVAAAVAPPIMDAITALLDVGDRRIDFQCLADCLAALSTQVVSPKAAKRGP